MIVRTLVALAVVVGGSAAASAFPMHSHHEGRFHYDQVYGKHNRHYHELYRSEHHHGTATGGPAGGLPHRN